MKSAAMTIFVLFFGLALVDAVWQGHVLRALFWVGIGVAFLLLSRRAPVGPGAGDDA